MHWKFKFDDEIREMNCCNGLFNLFKNSSNFMKNNGHIAIICMLVERKLSLRLPMLSATKPELRDHLY